MDDICKIGIEAWLRQAIHEATENAVEKCFPELDDNKKRLLIFEHEISMYSMLAPTIESSDEKTNEME
jgi:hypothetical protein